MSHFGWGEGCSRKLLKKTNLLPLLKPFDKTVIRMAEYGGILLTLETHLSKHSYQGLS